MTDKPKVTPPAVTPATIPGSAAVAKAAPAASTAMTVTDAASIMSVMKTGSAFLPRLQLMTSNSKQCKSGEFKINHYALIENNVLSDVGQQVDILVYAARLLAIDFSNEESIVAVYDPKLVEGEATGAFKDIMTQSEDSNSSCMWGTQFLVYLADAQSLATLFFGSKTARNDVPSMLARVGRAATLSSKKITTKKYEYYSMLVTSCSTPLEGPDAKILDKAMVDFNNPPVSEVEKVAPAQQTTQQAR